MLDLEPIKVRVRYLQTDECVARAIEDIEALVAEVERLRRQRAVDQDQIRSYARA